MSKTNGKKAVSTKIYLIQYLYSLWLKESDLVMAHLNAYKGIVSQLLAQGMKINDELSALMLMSILPPSWQTFVATMCNSSLTNITYSIATNSITFEDARRKWFVYTTLGEGETYAIQTKVDQQRNHSCSSS